MKYQSAVSTGKQAFCHLLLYFSLYEDGKFYGEEAYQVSTILKLYPFLQDVNFAEEVNVFFDYKNSIGDQLEYFKYLATLIAAVSPFIILFHAAQVAMSDRVYSESDDESLHFLTAALGIHKEQAEIILLLALQQRKMIVKGAF